MGLNVFTSKMARFSCVKRIFSLCPQFHWNPQNCIHLSLSRSHSLRREKTSLTSETGQSLLSIPLRQEYRVRGQGPSSRGSSKDPAPIACSLIVRWRETQLAAGWAHDCFIYFPSTKHPKVYIGEERAVVEIWLWQQLSNIFYSPCTSKVLINVHNTSCPYPYLIYFEWG